MIRVAQGDLEVLGYACAGADLCAACVGAPHIRQRLYWVAHAEGRERGLSVQQRGPQQAGTEPRWSCEAGGLGDTPGKGCEWSHTELLPPGQAKGRQFGRSDAWSDSVWHHCRDGKARRIPTQPALFPLADGLPGRVGLLRGAGNAIVPQVAAKFIQSVMECLP